MGNSIPSSQRSRRNRRKIGCAFLVVVIFVTLFAFLPSIRVTKCFVTNTSGHTCRAVIATVGVETTPLGDIPNLQFRYFTYHHGETGDLSLAWIGDYGKPKLIKVNNYIEGEDYVLHWTIKRGDTAEAVVSSGLL